jgi:hypothetical protein
LTAPAKAAKDLLSLCDNRGMTPSFYSDRVNGPVPRIHEQLPEATARGLQSLFETKVQANWLANEFPEHCADGNGVSGTEVVALWNNVGALLPQLRKDDWGSLSPTQTDEVLFDLIEYAANRVAKPIQGKWHEYMKHHELTFDEKAGRKAFRKDVNNILHRGGTMYELTSEMQIVRTGTPAVQQVMEHLTPASGDEELDGLLHHAKELFRSRDEKTRGLGLDKLWDAFTRLKTIDVQGNKKQSASILLGNIENEAFREITSTEMFALTDVGNDFMIRHHETGTHSVPPEAYDYLFARMGSLIVYLLKVSDRLG